MSTQEFFAKLGQHCRKEKGYCKSCLFREFCVKTAGELDEQRVALAEKLLSSNTEQSA